jgi:hypothetical protein
LSSQDVNDIVHNSILESVCGILVTDNAAGAQTERRGDAGPVRFLLGGETRRPPFFSVTGFYLTMRNPTAPGLTRIEFFSWHAFCANYSHET